MQLFQLVEPFHAFVVDRLSAGLAELQMDHPNAVAAVALRKFDDPPPDILVAVGPRHVPQRARAHPHDLLSPIGIKEPGMIGVMEPVLGS
jgi:hypothetical protein